MQRVKAPLTVWPAMARVAAVGDLGYTEAVGRAMGLEIAALGFNVDYAPVLDVHTNPANPIIGDRAFGTDARAAAAQALAFWRGLESAGVRGCGKHFPGHGDTATDSHLELPRVDADEARLRAVELVPFAAASEARVPMLMTAHVVYPALDAEPATMSKRWLVDVARGELGFSRRHRLRRSRHEGGARALADARGGAALASPPAATASSPAATPRCSATPRRRSTSPRTIRRWRRVWPRAPRACALSARLCVASTQPATGTRCRWPSTRSSPPAPGNLQVRLPEFAQRLCHAPHPGGRHTQPCCAPTL